MEPWSAEPPGAVVLRAEQSTRPTCGPFPPASHGSDHWQVEERADASRRSTNSGNSVDCTSCGPSTCSNARVTFIDANFDTVGRRAVDGNAKPATWLESRPLRPGGAMDPCHVFDRNGWLAVDHAQN